MEETLNKKNNKNMEFLKEELNRNTENNNKSIETINKNIETLKEDLNRNRCV